MQFDFCSIYLQFSGTMTIVNRRIRCAILRSALSSTISYSDVEDDIIARTVARSVEYVHCLLSNAALLVSGRFDLVRARWARKQAQTAMFN
jgi:hypothetical protein